MLNYQQINHSIFLVSFKTATGT